MKNLKRALWLAAYLVIISGCNPMGSEKFKVEFKNPTAFTDLKSQVSDISVVNNQLVISGSLLSNIKTATLKNGSQQEIFEVESATDNKLIANGANAISIIAGSVFDLILADAYGSATYQVTFTIADGAITAAKLNRMGATTGQVLKWNGSAWQPSSLANSQVYLGTWNASSDTPALASSSPTTGDYYIVTTPGTFNAIDYAAGDWVIYNGTTWDKIDNTSNLVASFKGRAGVVVPQSGDYTWAQITKTSSKLQDLADIDVSVRNNGDVLLWNSGTSKWVSSTFSSTPPADSVGTSQIADASVTYSKLSLGVGDIAQTKVNGLVADLASKEPSITAAGVTTKYYSGTKTWQTLDTSVVPENGNLYFTNAKALAVPLALLDTTTLTGEISDTDTILQAFGRTQNQINAIGTGSSGFVTKTGTSTVPGTIDTRTGFVLVGAPGSLNDATPKTYVDTQVATAVLKSGDTMSGDLTLNTQMKFKDGATNYITVKAPATVTAPYTLTLPPAVGGANQVLQTDASGVLSWAAAGGGGSVTSVTGTAPVVSSGGATPAISMAAATTSVAGYLTAADWTTFNGKASLASPTFTGVPLAPTAAVSTNSTQIATTAFVLGQVGTASPLMNSAVAVGSSLLYSRQDHVHPVDTSRSPLAGSSSITTVGTVTSGTWNGTTIAVANGGTGAGTLTAKGILYGNGTSAIGATAAAAAATPSVLLSTITTSVPVWTTSTATNFLQGSAAGVLFGPITNITPGATNFTLSQNAVTPFTSESTNAAADTLYLKAGKVGIGTNNPSAKLHVTGQIVSSQYVVASGATVDMNNGNVQILQSVGGSAITLNNMLDGASYSIIVSDATARTYTFSGCTNSHFAPVNAATTAASRTVYSIMKTTEGGAVHCYIAWITGFN